MLQKTLLLLFLAIIILLPFSINASTEVSYPSIPGVMSPQEIVQQAEKEEDVLPLFLAYIFNVLLLVSVVVIAGITIYVVSVYAISKENPEKKKKAKEWLINVLQGSLIVFTSYTILYALDSSLVLFQSKNLDDTDKPEEISMEWDLKTPYFQIPTGLIIEDAILNETAKSKFYDILEITENAESDLDEIIPIGQEIINIIEMCPVGRDCCGEILLANVEEMIENQPHHEEGANSWNEILDIIKEDPDFFDNFAKSIEEISGREITIEDIEIMALLEKLGFDPTTQMNPEEAIISSGIDDDGNLFHFYGFPEEDHNSLMLLPQEVIDSFKEEFDIDALKEIFDSENDNNLSQSNNSINKIASLDTYPHIRLSSSGFVPWNDPSFKQKLDQAKKDGKVVPTPDQIEKYKEMGYGGLNMSGKCANPWSKESDAFPDIDYEEEEPEGEPECPPCIMINPMIMSKIAEMQPYLISFSNNLDLLYESKNPLHEDLYQIYKVVMLKSLGYEHLINYPTLLFEKRIYDYENIVIISDTEKSVIGNYSWDWEQWINNIVYEIESPDGVISENDPATFYLKEIYTKEVIEDALRMAQEAKEKGFQNIDKLFNLDSEETNQSKNSILEKIIAFVKNIFKPNNKIIVFAQSPEEKLQECINEKELDIEVLDFFELLDICEIDYDESDLLLMSKLKDPSSFLSCGMEIPIGETIELTWNHLIKILDKIDEYIEYGKLFLERQEHMNSLAAQCECPCGNDSCPVECGNCELTCNLGEIIAVYNEILEIRAILGEIADEIRLLTYGHFNTPTEDVCDPLNEDIRDENEEEACFLGGSKLITNHELITRKLNYSRHAFDNCITLPEDIDEIYEGIKTPKLPVFAPIAEKKNLPRYTKTKENGEIMNTSDFNWFCCEGL